MSPRAPRVVVIPWWIVVLQWLALLVWLLARLVTWPVWGPVRWAVTARVQARALADEEGVPVPPTPVGRAARWVWRHRRTLVPVPVAAALAVTAATWRPAGLLAAAGWTVLAGLWIRSAGRRREAAWTSAAAAGWLAATVYRWPPATASGVLAAGTLALVAARGWRYRIRPTPPPDTTVEDAWLDMTGQGTLPGSYVIDGTVLDAVNSSDLPIGRQLDVQLVRGRQAADHARAARPMIASQYGIARDDVVISKPARDESLIRVTLLDHDAEGNPLTQVVRWEDLGPTLNPATGTYLHGMRVDQTLVPVQLWDVDRGARHGWVSGSTDGGKSSSLHTLLAEACLSGHVVPLIIDMKGGTSLSDWASVAPFYVTDPDDAVKLLRGLRAVGEEIRQPALRALKRTDPLTGEDLGAAPCLPVTPASPLLLLVIEEAPVLWEAHPKIASALFRWIVTTARVLELAGYLASQATTAGAAFDQDDVIRRQVRMGNQIVHRNSAGSGRETGESAVAIDPSTIPDVAGAGFVLGPADRSEMMMRSRWIEHPGPVVRRAAGVVPALPVAELDLLQQALAAPLHLPRQEPAPGGAGSISIPVPAGTVSPLQRVQQLRESVAAFVCGHGSTSTRAVVDAHPAYSRDQVERALRAVAAAGEITDAGHGRWADPIQVPAARR